MTDQRTISNIVQDRALPRFVKENYSTFVDFMGAYFEFMEQTKGTTDVAKNLINYSDIDNTLDDFVEHFRKKYMVNIPTSVLADKRLLAKNIKEFYLNKGNEASYKFLFRILYNEDVTLFYPKTLILKASAGKWQQNTSVKIVLSHTSALKFLANSKITGLVTGANAIVESVLQYTDRGVLIVELILSNVKGIFNNKEDISIAYLDGSNVIQTIDETLLELYSTVNITDPGSKYGVGNVIPIRQLDDVEIAQGTVIQVNRGPIVALTIEGDSTEGGHGYRGTQQRITSFYALPIDFTWNDIYLPDAPIVGDSVHYDFSSHYIFDTFAPVYLDGVGDPILIKDAPGGSGVGGQGIVSLVGNDGQLLEVTLLKPGTPYQAPFAVIVSDNGEGGVLNVSGGGGSVIKVQLEQHPIVLESDLDSFGTTVTPDFTSNGDAGATGTLNTSSLVMYPGDWIGEDGKLSSIMVLQDSFFYQDYSYVIQTGIDESVWKDVIERIIHPAGLALFGEVIIREQPQINTHVTATSMSVVSISDDFSAPVTFADSIIATWTTDSIGDLLVPTIV